MPPFFFGTAMTRERLTTLISAAAILAAGALAYAYVGQGTAQNTQNPVQLNPPAGGQMPTLISPLGMGEVQLTFASSPTVAPNISSGRLKPLAVTTLHRSKLFPQLPTVAESGVPNYEAQSWYGFVVPAKTPVAIIARLNKEIVQILNRPETAEALLKSGMEPWSSTPDAFGASLKAEYNKWGRIIKAAGISAN